MNVNLGESSQMSGSSSASISNASKHQKKGAHSAKAESKPKSEFKPKAESKPKTEFKPKPKTESKPKAESTNQRQIKGQFTNPIDFVQAGIKYKWFKPNVGVYNFNFDENQTWFPTDRKIQVSMGKDWYEHIATSNTVFMSLGVRFFFTTPADKHTIVFSVRESDITKGMNAHFPALGSGSAVPVVSKPQPKPKSQVQATAVAESKVSESKVSEPAIVVAKSKSKAKSKANAKAKTESKPKTEAKTKTEADAESDIPAHTPVVPYSSTIAEPKKSWASVVAKPLDDKPVSTASDSDTKDCVEQSKVVDLVVINIDSEPKVNAKKPKTKKPKAKKSKANTTASEQMV